MTSKYTRHPFFHDVVPLKQQCEHEGCLKKGEFKAPHSRHHLRKYWWFCLEHVRAYNENWNYYQGMDPYEVEKEKRRDETWQRPTWPFTQTIAYVKSSLREKGDSEYVKGEEFYHFKVKFDPYSREAKALVTMDIEFPFTKKQLKERYLKLAKQYHPDTNQGSREAEERLKEINLAYEVLKDYLLLRD